MTDQLPTLWPIEPHTIAKHAILRRYLQAWLPILSRQGEKIQARFGRGKSSPEILYIDGFAGPGEYANRESGSPVIALKEAIDHKQRLPLPIRMLFVELDKHRFDHLCKMVDGQKRRLDPSKLQLTADLQQGDCDAVLNSMLDSCEKQSIKFGPALAFLDQFGYGAVSMQLIKRILGFAQCEVFTYLNYKDMNRWITDDHKAEAFSRAFGSEEWRGCVLLGEKQRREELLRLYKLALKQKAGAQYVVSFLMYDRVNRPLYWLLFCTNNLRGLEEMKKAMWSVDKDGDFRFSDKDQESQLELLEKAYDQKWLAEELKSKLRGKELSALELKEFVLVHTPCYLFKMAAKGLELNDDLKVIRSPDGRRPGTFPDEHLSKIQLRFRNSMF